MDLFKFWRRQGWTTAPFDAYVEAHRRFGGSVITHPQLLAKLSDLLELRLEFAARYLDGELIGALPLWGKYIAGTKSAMRGLGRRDWVDMGNAEVILPLSPQHRFDVRYKATFLSDLHRQHIDGLRLQPPGLSLAKTAQSVSKKFKYNRRRELRLLREAGGEIVSLDGMEAAEIAKIYMELFQRRWNRPPEGHERLTRTIETLREFIKGHLARLDGEPVAIQLLYWAESPGWLSVEYVNGAMDPAVQALDVGSVLTHVNTSFAEERAEHSGKTLRYSFGKANEEYKKLWCNGVPVYRI